jgi:hypothetical protein
MKREFLKKSQSYAVVFILIGTGFLPLLSMASSASPSSVGTTQDVKKSTANDTQYWALLVGVGVYAENPEQDRPDMLLEVNDLHALLLQSPWWSEDHIKVLEGENATVSNILAGLRWLDHKDNKNDISVVYLSTHGFPLGIDIPPKDEADGTDEALVSYWGFAFPMAFIWDDELNVLLNRLESKGVCLIVDSCYAGGFNDPPNWNITNTGIQPAHKMSAGEWVKGFGEDVRGQKRVVLMGSREDELSYSGGFGPYIIDGLRGYADTNGDNVVSAEEVFYYAQPRSPMQHPTMYDGYAGDLPLITVNPAMRTSHTTAISERAATVNSNNPLEQVGVSAETSQLRGYVKDAGTTIPIANATIDVRGRINQYEDYENQTTTDQAGYYNMHVPAGRFRITASAPGYCDKTTPSYHIYENQTVWVNISLYPRPLETATVCGYITNNKTSGPIGLANVSLFWQGNQNQSYRNVTVSDSNGFYRMSVAPGEIALDVSKNGYFSESLEGYTVSDFATVWLNVSLYPSPAENAIVCGYVTDDKTGDPLPGTRVDVLWTDIAIGHEYNKEALTNVSGFFSMNIAPGELYVDIREQGYEYYDPYRHDAFENKTTWMNISLSTGTISVDFARPLQALYINDKRVSPFAKARIIGPITIEAYIPGSFYGPGQAEKVEFYVDGALKATVTTEPYNWTWTQRTVGKHVIKIVAYDAEGNSASKELEVTKFL